MKFSDRVKYHTSLIVFKTLHDFSPAYMRDIIYFSRNTSLRSSTQNDLALIDTPRTKYYKDTFTYYSFLTWNKLPTFLKNTISLNNFKNNCKKFIMQTTHPLS